MRPEDERRDDEARDEPADPADEGAVEPPPPATWAGRRRAASEQAEADASDPGATQEFDPLAAERAEHSDEPEPAEEEEPGEAEAPEDGAGDAEAADEGAGEAGAAEQAGEGDEERAAEPAAGVAEGAEARGAEEGDRPSDATDAALAGLRARTAQHAAGADAGSAEATGAEAGSGEAVAAEEAAGDSDGAAATGSAEAAPAEAEAAPAEAGAGSPPKPAVAAAADEDGGTPHAKRIWARFLAASLVIVISRAAATSSSLLFYLTDSAEGLGDNDKLASLRDQLADVNGGSPQTILILGSDKRKHTQGDPGRSDTTLLLRVDPDKDRIALLSIPRDLKVTIPNYGVGKFNEAYTVGGADLTTRVVKQLTGLEINHVVNINFTGFADAVNAIGGVYVDVDRQYYVPEGSEYSAIDPPIDAGYQLMKGLKALQYVRFRHDDNDLVRSARQQDFLREARQKLPPGTLIRDRNELLDIFTEYTTSDIGDAVPLLELLKTFAAVQSAPVVEVHFPADLGDGTSGYVTASDEAIKETVHQFLDTEGTPGERPAGEGTGSEKPQKPHGSESGGEHGSGDDDHFEGPPMEDATAVGQQFAQQIADTKQKDGDRMIDFPIYYPTRLSPGSTLDDYSRAFPIDGPGDDVYHGYKFVAEFFAPGGYYEYYGVSGTDWVDAPILANPSETRTIDGRDYLLFYDGDRLREVGWKTDRAAYWVSNSLLQALDEGQMLSIATSMRELDN